MLSFPTPSACIGSIVFILTLLLPWHASARVVISEVLWSGSPVSSADEWLEMTCEDSKDAKDSNELCPVDIGGWSILSRGSSGQDALMVRFATGTVIHSGQYFLVSNYAAAESALSIEPDFVTTAVSLPNANLKLTLTDREGVVIDEVDDGSGNPFAGKSTDPRASMERISFVASGTDPENWKTADAAVNVDEGIAMFGTPGQGVGSLGSLGSLGSSLSSISSISSDSQASSAFSSFVSSSLVSSMSPMPFMPFSSEPSSSSQSSTSSAPSPRIILSELLPDPAGTDDREWIEIQNAGDMPVDVTGWKLKRGTASYIFPSRTDAMFLVAPKEFRIFYKFESKLSLPNDGGLVELYDASGALIDSMTYNGSPEGVSTAIDDFGQRKSFCVPTPLGENGVRSFDARIDVQSGLPTDYDNVTLNLQTLVDGASLGSSTCAWDFGDGETSDSCNPPSHTWEEYGVYPVKLSVTDACAETVEKTLDVVVLEKKKIQKSEMSERSQKSEMNNSAFTSVSSASSFSSVSSKCTPSSSTGIIISSVYPSPKKGEDESVTLENISDDLVDLCGWSIDDVEHAGSKPWSFSGSLIIEPHSFLKLPGKQIHISLNNGGDDVRILNADGSLVASVTYPSVKTGKSFSQSSSKKAVQKLYSDIVTTLTENLAPIHVTYERSSQSRSSSGTSLEDLPDVFRDAFQTASGREIAFAEDAPALPSASKTPSSVPWIVLLAQSFGAAFFALRRIFLP